MMFKRFSALLTVFLLIFQIIAYADLIVTPGDNDFFFRHKKDFTYVGRSYYANGINGFISLKTAPTSNTEVSKIANGNIVFVQYTYNHNKEQWGVVIDKGERTGWVSMNQLVLVYDYESFYEDHKNEFYEYEGNYESLKRTEGKLVLWLWPGSGKIAGILEEDSKVGYYNHSETIEELEEYFLSVLTYKDKQGREWVFIDRINLYYKNVWICVTEPDNSDIPVFNPAPKPTLIKSKGNDFLRKSDSSAEQLDRRFCINSPSGYVTPKEEPGAEKEILIVEYKNGDIVYMARTYLLDGKYWGVTASGYTYPPSGWIPMDELLMLYECQDFEEENEDKLYAYTGSYDAVLDAKLHVFWQWPGSDREKKIVDAKDCVLKDVVVLYAYRDNQEREWGYVNINYTYTYESGRTYESSSEGWICLSSPSDSNISAFNPAPKPAQWLPDGNYKWTHNDPAGDSSNQYSLSNVIKINTYEQNKTFTDVAEAAWYKDAIASAYEYDIICGVGGNKFEPDRTLTGAEALTIASRIHACYKYEKLQGDRLINQYNASNKLWWDGTVNYCKSEGLISGSEFEDYKYLEYPIIRAQMVHAFSKILQPKDMPKLNTVIKLPDVNKDTNYSDDIILFYEAGIVGGVDADGTFNPDSNVTRAEAAIIFMNLIDAGKRHSGRSYGS